MSEVHYETPEGRTWVIKDGIVYGAEAEIGVWVNDRLGGGMIYALAVAIGVLKPNTDPSAVNKDTLPGLLAAGAYFFNHQSDDDVSDLCVSVAADDIATANPKNIRAVLDYPFGQLKTRRLTAEIDLSNVRAVRQAEAIGFKLEGRKRRMAANGGDIGVFGLLPDETPFWGKSA